MFETTNTVLLLTCIRCNLRGSQKIPDDALDLQIRNKKSPHKNDPTFSIFGPAFVRH